jgi:hypothetical protein
MAQFGDLRQFHALLHLPVVLLIDDGGDIHCLLLGDPSMQDAHDIVESDVILMVDSLEEDLYVVDDALLEDDLVDPRVHLDEAFKRDALLLSEDFLQHLWSDGDAIHVEHHFKGVFKSRK